MGLSDTGLSGALKKAYDGTVSCSRYSPLGPVSKSKTLIEKIEPPGNVRGVNIWLHAYEALWLLALDPEQLASSVTRVP